MRSEIFSYIKKLPNEINEYLNEIENLRKENLDFSVQELQSMNILSDGDQNRNLEILKNIETYLGKCNSFLKNHVPVKQLNVIELDNNVGKKSIGEEIDVNLETLEDKVYTLSNLAFKANKLTKVLCERTIEILEGKHTYQRSFDNQTTKANSFAKVVSELHRIYRNSNSEINKGSSTVEEQLENLLNTKIKKDTFYNGWNGKFKDKDENGHKISDRKALISLYNDLCQIWNVRDVLYEIKSQLNTELMMCLVSDNYQTFNKWGLVQDEKGMWVLNFDSNKIIERYAFHIPDIEKSLNSNLIERLTNSKFQYRNTFTSGQRKNDMSMIIAGDDYIKACESSFLNLLKEVDFNDLDNDEKKAKANELYILGKFMAKGTYERIVKEHPELNEKCEILKEIIYPERKSRGELSDIDLKKSHITEYEDKVHNQIVDLLKSTGTVYIQKGNNLDKQACIYALKKFMKENYDIEIKIEEIDAGQDIRSIPNGTGLIVDAGNLRGIENFNERYNGSKIVNANANRAEKSACAKLRQYGFDIPDKIIQYADEVIKDERLILARYGLNVARLMKGEQLFKFANARRQDGTYLIEAVLTDSELEEYSTESCDLRKACDKRDKELEDDIRYLAKHIYQIKCDNAMHNDSISNENSECNKYLVAVTGHVNCGAQISYLLGANYFASVAHEKPKSYASDVEMFYDDTNYRKKATFAVMANPLKGDGKLPEEILTWASQIRDGKSRNYRMATMYTSRTEDQNQNESAFIKPSHDMAIFGGPKTPHLYVVRKKEDVQGTELSIADELLYEITQKFNVDVMEDYDIIKNIIKNSASKWKNEEAKKVLCTILDIEYEKMKSENDRKLAKETLVSIIKSTEVADSDVDYIGEELLNITKEKGGENRDIDTN